MVTQDPLSGFHPVVRTWFSRTFEAPSPPQVLGWPSIASGKNTLILAPTGSGKTLTAFLWAINHLLEQRLREHLEPGVRIVYVSPLKALNNDIERNLEAPLQGIREEAQRQGLKIDPIRTAVRTGDTPQSRRAAMIKHPPDILITTPESLYLMLTSRQARKMFETTQYLIVDEIHSLCNNKRGVHLSLTLERLQRIAGQEMIRIGLSATQRPLEEIAAYLGGQTWETIHGNRHPMLHPRPVAIVDAGQKKAMDLSVECPVPDFSVLPQDSVWPMVWNALLRLIHSHTSTLVFVNNRRLAERVAAKLNEMVRGQENEGTAAGRNFNLYAVPVQTGPPSIAPPDDERELVRAYHGSMSKEAREEMEAELKAGKLRALITTSSLELGIDIGSIDLVVQLQSPKGIARGLQRVGRSGHLITATSKGRVFPTHRQDLVEAAVIGREMLLHNVERTSIPRDCLDVLAQQIVAMVSVEDWDVEGLHDLIRQSYCYRETSRELYGKVLEMLAGRYSAEVFRELRPRISWDKVHNTLRALPGSGHLAITSGGTIADRGYFGVYLEDGKTKVGEVDEEFVFETRTGDAFILGTSVWRVVGMDVNRLTVAPAPGQPARMPFWRGEGIGRSFELGKTIAQFRRDLQGRMDDPLCLHWLQEEFPIDSRAAWNILEYFRRQKGAVGVIPNDRLLLIEGFRDEIGDPRIVVHSAFGRPVNGLLGLVLSHRLHAALGVEPQMLYNDDGILLRSPDVDIIPLDLLDGITLRECQDLLMEEVLQSPLFGGQFRQNAGRALIMPRRFPGARTPMWLQRLRAKDLLQAARQYEDFPIVIETLREVLHDILDYDNFAQIIRGIEQGSIHVQSIQTEIPSPFTASLLFDFMAVYMYEWDQPRADKLSRYLAINRDLLSEIVDLDSVSTMVRPEAIASVEDQLQHSSEGTRARSPEELFEVLLRIGDLSEEEIIARCVGDGRTMLRVLEGDGRATRVDFPAGPRWIAAEERPLYADLTSDQNARQIMRRYLQSHGPLTSRQLAERFGIGEDRVRSLVSMLPAEARIISGRFRPEAERTEWCYRPNMERIHRHTITLLRKEITPCKLSEFTRFLFHWQHLDPSSRVSGSAGLEECFMQLHGLSLPADVWERDILSARLKDFATSLLNHFSSSGSVVWIGAGPAKLRPILRGEGNLFLSVDDPGEPTTPTESARRILDFLHEHGASFLSDLRGGTRLSLAALNAGIAELVWSGLITNDLFTEIVSVKSSTHLPVDTPLERVELLDPLHNRRKAKLLSGVRKAIRQSPGWSGRWSLTNTPGIMGELLTVDERAALQALVLLNRYGIVAREFVRRETLLPWPLLAAELQRMEMRSEVRRGYFVEGLSGMQYALPAAVEELRRVRAITQGTSQALLVNACDPANPFGTGIEPALRQTNLGSIRFARLPGNHVGFHDGIPVLYSENYGRRLWSIGEPDLGILTEMMKELTTMVGTGASPRPIREIMVEYFDGTRPAGSPIEGILRSLGFFRERNQTMRYDGVRGGSPQGT